MGMFDQALRDLRQIIFRDAEQNAIPAMDGALSPNDRLDNCQPIGAPLPDVDAVVSDGREAIYVSAGTQVLKLSGAGFADRSVVATFDGAAGGLALHPDGRLLVCVAGQGLAAFDPARPADMCWLKTIGTMPLVGLTDVAAAPDGTIFLTEGSAGRTPDTWRRDLMEKRSQGRFLCCRADLTAAQVLIDGLAFPYGLAIAGDGTYLCFTESWAHRLNRLPLDGGKIGAPTPMLANMAGYPARLCTAAGGGFWLALFAVRTHLIEFILKENDFRTEMLSTIPEHYWVAPAFASGNDCLEPMQIGSIKALGIQKPWAPPRSYGLLARLDGNGEIVESLHSRVGGRHHGIVAARETPQGLVIVAKGSASLLLQPLEDRQ